MYKWISELSRLHKAARAVASKWAHSPWILVSRALEEIDSHGLWYSPTLASFYLKKFSLVQIRPALFENGANFKLALPGLIEDDNGNLLVGYEVGFLLDGRNPGIPFVIAHNASGQYRWVGGEEIPHLSDPYIREFFNRVLPALTE